MPDTPKTDVRVAFKGFDAELKCRGFQYEIGKTYKHKGEVIACERGFHACEHPFDVWSYYPPSGNRYALVELGGDIKDHDDDTKLVSAEITVNAEITIHEFVQCGVDYILSTITAKKTESKTDYHSAATNTGDRSAATVEGGHSIAIGAGYKCRAKAIEGSAICLVERDEQMKIIYVFAAIAKKRGKVKPDTYYELVGGKPVECTP